MHGSFTTIISDVVDHDHQIIIHVEPPQSLPMAPVRQNYSINQPNRSYLVYPELPLILDPTFVGTCVSVMMVPTTLSVPGPQDSMRSGSLLNHFRQENIKF